MQTVSENQNKIQVGQIYTKHYGRALVISISAGENSGNIYSIGAGGLTPTITDTRRVNLMYGIPSGDNPSIEDITAASARYTVSYQAMASDLTPDRLVDTWTPEQVKAAVAAHKTAQERQSAKQRESEYTRAKQVLQGRMILRRPAWAKAIIVGYLETDDCDSQSDYFNVKSGAVHLLAWSRHTRDLFQEMRKAAKNCPNTAHLADAPSSSEHREKYSMGAGYYLKNGGRYNTGWKVKKIGIYDRIDDTHHAAVAAGRCFIPGVKCSPLPELPDRDTLTDLIVSASRRLCPPIRPITQVEGDNGQWYGIHGVPWGVKTTGNTRVNGYGYEKDGATCATQRYQTEDQARQAWTSAEDRKADEFTAQLLTMEDGEIYAQAVTWLKDCPALAPANVFVEEEGKGEAEEAAALLDAGTVDVRLNDAFQGVEVRFSEKPPTEILDRLRAHGFRWHRRRRFWYAKQRPDRMAVAYTLKGEAYEEAAA